MKCDKCGAESDNKNFFKTEREPFSKRKTLCLSCQAAKEAAIHKVSYWALLALGLFGVLLIIASPASPPHPLFLNLGLVAIGGIACTLAHEIGHAMMGKLVGFRIFALELGIGQNAFEFQRFGFRWRFNKIPVGGRVYGLPKNTHGLRIKQTLLVLGGPATNAVLFLLAWKFRWLDTALAQTRFSGFFPMRYLMLLNGFFFIATLAPYRGSRARGSLPSDGLNIWLTWVKSTETLANFRASYYLLEAEECRREYRLEQANCWIDQGLRELPGDKNLLFSRATYLLFENKLSEARQALLGLRELLANDTALFPFLFNNLAYVDALIGSPELLPEADDHSERALKANPCSPYFKGTRGFVLVMLDRYEEGVSLLKQAFNEHTDKAAKATNACLLGIAAQRQGNLAESRNYFEIARQIDPRCSLLNRAPKD